MALLIQILCWLFIWFAILLVFPIPTIVLTAIGIPLAIIAAVSGK